MQIDFSQALTNLDGTPLAQANLEGGQPIPITLRLTATEALCRPTDERGMTGAQKFERFSLALRINQGDPVELTPEEVATIKQRIGETMPPIIVGRAYQLLDPPTTNG
jgi:hypothetical protein